jgi:thimet oligopeptidase
MDMLPPILLACLALIVLGGCAATGSSKRLGGTTWPLEQTPLDRSAAEFGNQATEHLAWAAAFRDRALEVSGPRTLSNTLDPLNQMLMHVDAAAAESALFARVHPQADVRAAAERAEQEVERFKTETRLNRKLLAALQIVDTTDADAGTRYALFKMIRDARRAGVE